MSRFQAIVTAPTHSTTDDIDTESFFPRDERFLYATNERGERFFDVYEHAPGGR